MSILRKEMKEVNGMSKTSANNPAQTQTSWILMPYYQCMPGKYESNKQVFSLFT